MFRVAVLAALAACVVTACSSTSLDTEANTEASAVAHAQQPLSAPVVASPPPVVDTSIEALEALQPVQPSRLTIGSLGLDMEIQAVGILADGNMEIPASALVAGWYRYGAAPSQGQGNTVLAAHVDDASVGLGPFASLRDLAPGEQITVVDVEGATYLYQVTKVEQTSKTNVDTQLLFNTTGPDALVLVTCGGRWNSSIGHYDDNVIVWAEPVR